MRAETTSTTHSSSVIKMHGKGLMAFLNVDADGDGNANHDHDQPAQPPRLYRRDPSQFHAPVPKSAPIAITNAFAPSEGDFMIANTFMSLNTDYTGLPSPLDDLHAALHGSPRVSARDSISTDEERSRGPFDASSDEELEQPSDTLRRPCLGGTAGESADRDAGHDSMAMAVRQSRLGAGAASPLSTHEARVLASRSPKTVRPAPCEARLGMPPPSLAATLHRIRQDARVQRKPLPPGLWAVVQTVQAWEDFGLSDRKADVDEMIDPRWLIHHVAWFDPNTRHVLNFAMGNHRQWHVNDFSALYTDRFDPRGSFLDQFAVLPASLRDTAVPNALLDCLAQPVDRADARWQAHYDYARDFFCKTFVPAMGIANIATMRLFSFHVARDAEMAKAIGDYLQRVCKKVLGQPAETGPSVDGAAIAGFLGELARCIDTDRAWQHVGAALRTNVWLLLAATVRGHWSRNPWCQRAWIITLIEKLPLCRSRHLVHELGVSMVMEKFLEPNEWNALNDLLPVESQNDIGLFREQVSYLRIDTPRV